MGWLLLCISHLFRWHDPSRPERELSQGAFLLLCAERCRSLGLPDWLQLVALLHGCGALLACLPPPRAGAGSRLEGDEVEGGNRGVDQGGGNAWGAEDWSAVPAPCLDESWLVGCPLPECMPTGGGGGGAATVKPQANGAGAGGAYPARCGVAIGAVQPCWTSHEYMYHFLRHNAPSSSVRRRRRREVATAGGGGGGHDPGSDGNDDGGGGGGGLPWEALSALRLAPLRCWHTRGAYPSLSDAGGSGGAGGGPGGGDASALVWAQVLDEVVAAASASAASRRLHPDRAPKMREVWPYYAAIAARYLPEGPLEW